MAEEKESIGFRTSAKVIQDALERAQDELSKEHVGWSRLLDRIDSMREELGKAGKPISSAESEFEMQVVLHLLLPVPGDPIKAKAGNQSNFFSL